MRVGSLFSGGGLGDFGFMAAGMDIAWQCEIDEYCQKILELRYPESTKYRDIKTLKGDELEPVDIITGGFPCQPHSTIGHRKGADDERDLWPEMLRVIETVEPRWIVGENVSGITGTILDKVLSDLEAIGYETGTLIFSAHSLGAPHLRERLWIVANAKSDKQNGIQGETISLNVERYSRLEFKCNAMASWRHFWASEPTVGRVANGIADRVHRLKMLGNGQVPACTYVIGKMIMEIENGLA